MQLNYTVTLFYHIDCLDSLFLWRFLVIPVRRGADGITKFVFSAQIRNGDYSWMFCSQGALLALDYLVASVSFQCTIWSDLVIASIAIIM